MTKVEKVIKAYEVETERLFKLAVLKMKYNYEHLGEKK